MERFSPDRTNQDDPEDKDSGIREQKGPFVFFDPDLLQGSPEDTGSEVCKDAELFTDGFMPYRDKQWVYNIDDGAGNKVELVSREITKKDGEGWLTTRTRNPVLLSCSHPVTGYSEVGGQCLFGSPHLVCVKCGISVCSRCGITVCKLHSRVDEGDGKVHCLRCNRRRKIWKAISAFFHLLISPLVEKET